MARNSNLADLRIIRTARDKASINMAAENGYKPLVKKLDPSEDIRSKYSVVQHKHTGQIKVLTDFRSSYEKEDLADYEIVIDWTFYYPHNFRSPFAAYLVPKDIVVGERVFIIDLIEDYIGASWNQGDTYRLESCEAIWNGEDFEIQYEPGRSRSGFVG